MITVWSLLWGDKYPSESVYVLRDMVARNLSIPHEFKCVTDRDLPGVYTMAPEWDYPGWWGKVGLFKPGFADEFNVWFDLDVVITGLLDPLPHLVRNGLAAPWNWAQSGHGGVQSSVMAWSGGCEVIWEAFDAAQAIWPPRNVPGQLWGDQEWITVLRDDGRLPVTQIPEPWVRSYKYHCRGAAAPPPDCRVVAFHGPPKPTEVSDPWVAEHYRTSE